MSNLLSTLVSSASGMAAQSFRLRLSSENIANTDTPGYRRKTVSFENEVRDGAMQVQTGPVTLSRAALKEIYDPAHPLAGPEGYFQGSNVNLMVEIADAREAQRSYEANLKIFDQAREMASALLDLLRR